MLSVNANVFIPHLFVRAINSGATQSDLIVFFHFVSTVSHSFSYAADGSG